MFNHIRSSFIAVYGHEREFAKYMLSLFSLSSQMISTNYVLTVIEVWEDFPHWLMQLQTSYFNGLGSIKAIFDICKKHISGRKKLKRKQGAKRFISTEGKSSKFFSCFSPHLCFKVNKRYQLFTMYLFLPVNLTMIAKKELMGHDLATNTLRDFQVASGKKKPACQCRRCKRCRFNPWAGKIPWSKKCQHTPVFLPGKFHGQRSLVLGNSPWACKE